MVLIASSSAPRCRRCKGKWFLWPIRTYAFKCIASRTSSACIYTKPNESRALRGPLPMMHIIARAIPSIFIRVQSICTRRHHIQTIIVRCTNSSLYIYGAPTTIPKVISLPAVSTRSMCTKSDDHDAATTERAVRKIAYRNAFRCARSNGAPRRIFNATPARDAIRCTRI